MSALGDRFLGPIRGLVKQITKRVDYYALYSAVVNVDNGATVDLTPEDARFASMQGIPKLYGVPGMSATLMAGAKVLFTHQNGDPSRPCVVLYDGASTPTQVTLNATAVNLGDALNNVVRYGDTLAAGLVSGGGPVTGTLAGAGTPPTKVKA